MTLFSKIKSGSAKDLLQFFKSTSFSKAILVGIAITVPIIFGIWSDRFEIGLALCFGAFWSSPSDVSGSYRHKKNGILLSAFLAMVVSFIGGYLRLFSPLLLVPVLGILVFAISIIAVYGFRASLISFSGLLALVLSFAHTVETIEVYQYALLIGLGGLWYLVLSTLLYRLNPKAQTEEIMSEAFLLTAEYLETRSELLRPLVDRKKLQSEILKLQSALTEKHETLREILIQSRTRSGKSNYQGKRLLVFVELIDILETAMANPVQYDKMDALFEEHPEYVQSFQNLVSEIAKQLKGIGEAGQDSRRYPSNAKLSKSFEVVRRQIESFNGDESRTDYRQYLILQNLFEYQEKQFEKLKQIKWLLGNPDSKAIDFIDRDISKRFIVHQDYDPKILWRNLSLKSTIFKHALRLAVTVMIGYVLGILFDFQNPYWILLTIIVIMRPSYGLTKSRTKDRIIGTLVGGGIASGLVFMIQDPYVYGGLGIASLVIALSMVQKNYKASATFITLSVVFVYAIIKPNVLTVIQFRILDTLIGALLSFLALRFLWPAWSFLEIRTTVESSIKANRAFLNCIAIFYENKGKVSTNYRISRKEAFLETSNLSSAFQRMAQEPKSKQKNLDKIGILKYVYSAE
ncbi:hypothetical protein LCGC14_0708450 [marine sediment metagenome]|uniref:Uncharacterized protein n=1 Tax=marine sediment metagenome TaxID=412755 RepID=A0A0F9T1Q7_9ZZZZ